MISLLIGILGAGILAAARRRLGKPIRRGGFAAGGPVLAVGLALTITSGIHAISVARMWADLPAPGRMIDVGGFEMHLLAEGENDRHPTVVWIPGGHSAGYDFPYERPEFVIGLVRGMLARIGATNGIIESEGTMEP